MDSWGSLTPTGQKEISGFSVDVPGRNVGMFFAQPEQH